MSTKCVSFGNVDKTSKSASSAILLAVSTKVVRLGMDCASDDCMLATRFRARRSVCNLGERGKFPSTWMSLSVKSMASSGCVNPAEVSKLTSLHKGNETYASNTQILNRGYLMSCTLKYSISTQLASMRSIMFFPASTHLEDLILAL